MVRVALDRPANNFDSIALHKVLEIDFTALEFHIGFESNNQSYQNMNGQLLVNNGPPIVKLYLKYYVDQLSHIPRAILCERIELKIKSLLGRVGGSFLNREVAPYREESNTWTVSYQLRLNDYDIFVRELDKLYRNVAYAEFTEALESKLSED